MITAYKRCAVSAIICSLTNLAALIMSGVFISSGSLLVSLDERKLYLSSHTAEWSLGWLLWMIAAAAFFTFYCYLTQIIAARGRANILAYAMIIIAVGISFDISALIGFMMLPYLTSKPAIFLEREWLFYFMACFVANGLYTIGGTIILNVAYRIKALPKWLILSSIPAGIPGYWLCAATLKYCPPCMEYSFTTLILLFVIWSGIAGVWAFRKSLIAN